MIQIVMIMNVLYVKTLILVSMNGSLQSITVKCATLIIIGFTTIRSSKSHAIASKLFVVGTDSVGFPLCYGVRNI